MSKEPIVFQIVGYSNTGKTTLLTELIQLFERQGMRVGVMKHDGAHDFELDRPGKDTHRFSQAGASFVAIQSRTKTAIIQQEALGLNVLAQRLADAGAELILAEGFKKAHDPKLVLLREPEHVSLLAELTNVVAVASWFELHHPSVPVFSVGDIEGIYRFIRGFFSKNKSM